MEKIVEALIERSGDHDNSKMEDGARHLGLEFRAQPIEDFRELSPVDDMDLIDLIEMVCDWKAASKRVKDGSFLQSLAVNAKRFNLSPQLAKIIANTKLFEEE